MIAVRNFWLYHEDADVFIRELIADVMSDVDDRIQTIYIERQSVPFVLNDLKDAVCQIVDVRTSGSGCTIETFQA